MRAGPREEDDATDVKPWQMTVESGRRRRLGIVLLYKSRFLLTRDVENARRGTASGVSDDDEVSSAAAQPRECRECLGHGAGSR